MRKTIIVRVRWGVIAFACQMVACALMACPQSESDARSADDPAPPKSSGRDDRLLQGLDRAFVPRRPAPPAAMIQQADPAGGSVGSVVQPFGAGSDLGQQDPLARIGTQMRQVQQMLTERNVSSQTQLSQRQIVEQLDVLIAALASAQQMQQQQRATEKPPGDDQPSQKTGQDAARNSAGQSDESSSGTPPLTVLPSSVEEIWGHLPERVRRQMQNASALEFLPKYRRLIEDYYKRLAEDRGN